MTGNVKIIGGGQDPFTRSVIHVNDTHIETAENLELVIKHYNLIQYSDNYQDTVGSLYQFKRDEQPTDDDGDPTDVTTANSSSFKYKSSLLTGLTSKEGGAGANAYRTYKNAQILVSLK